MCSLTCICMYHVHVHTDGIEGNYSKELCIKYPQFEHIVVSYNYYCTCAVCCEYCVHMYTHAHMHVHVSNVYMHVCRLG